MLLNATGSLEVLKTADEVFEHAFGYGNAVLMSDVDFRPVLASSEERFFTGCATRAWGSIPARRTTGAYCAWRSNASWSPCRSRNAVRAGPAR